MDGLDQINLVHYYPTTQIYDGWSLASEYPTITPANLGEKDKPKLIICHTIKGKGIAVAENNPKWHHKNNLGKKDIEELYNSLS